LPAQRRRQARQWEWAEQIALAEQLAELLPPGVFWTSIDNQPWSKVAGIRRKRRGCRAGTPDILLLCGRLIGLELKSLSGRVSRAQEEVRLQILRAGGMWVMVRTARAALVALHRLGVPFRRAWKPPALEPWEEPVSDPAQVTVWHPEVLRQWRDDKKQWRLRQQRVRKAAKLAAERDDAARR